MSLSSSEVIQIDATVIIGLLILLTFQNVSNPIFEENLKVTKLEFNKLNIEYEALQQNLALCAGDKTVFGNELPDLINYVEDLSATIESEKNDPEETFKRNIGEMYEILNIPYYINIDGSLPKAFFANCDTWQAKQLESELKLVALQDWASDEFNFEFKKEALFDYDLINSKIDQYSDQNAMFVVYMNIINFFMVVPFAVSAIIEAKYTSTKTQNESKTSKAGNSIMIVGFGTVIIGLVVMIINLLLSNRLL